MQNTEKVVHKKKRKQQRKCRWIFEECNALDSMAGLLTCLFQERVAWSEDFKSYARLQALFHASLLPKVHMSHQNRRAATATASEKRSFEMNFDGMHRELSNAVSPRAHRPNDSDICWRRAKSIMTEIRLDASSQRTVLLYWANCCSLLH